MKFTINKKVLEKHLENVSRALLSTNPFPALTGILIHANESNIQFVVSNGNLSIKEIVEFTEETRVTVAGKILVPGKLFKDIIRKQSDLIEISADDNLVTITSKGSKTTINLLNISDYPIISFDSFGQELIIEASDLNNLIKNVAFAAAENDRRIILNGINLVARDGFLIASATNSFRMAQEKVKIDSNVEFDITIISKNLKDFFPATAKGKLNIKVDNQKIITSYENSTIVSKLIDGIYPEINKLIPTTFAVKLKMKSKDLIELIEKATVISEESSRIVKLTISEDDLIIESRRSEIGDALVKTKEFASDAETFSIVFNGQFLKEAASKFAGEIVLSFSGEFKVFLVSGVSNQNLLQLILPHRSF